MEEVLGKDSVLNAEPRQPTIPAVAWTVRVGYRSYAIEDWSPFEASARESYGECDNHTGTIRIRADLRPDKAANTMLHEVLHACWYVAGLEDDDKQERTVACLANQLTQVWRDNPALVDWINARLVPQPGFPDLRVR